MKYFILLFVLLFLKLCHIVEPDEKSSFNIDYIIGTWNHSFEEQTDSVQIYRPSNYMVFPPSRYRQKYTFGEDGIASWFVLANNDGHFYRNGHWIYNDKDQISIIDSSGTKVNILTIIELEPDLLRFYTNNEIILEKNSI